MPLLNSTTDFSKHQMDRHFCYESVSWHQVEHLGSQNETAWSRSVMQSALISTVCPHSRVSSGGGGLSVDGAKWWELQLSCGTFIFNFSVVGWAALLAAAAAAVQKGSGEWLAQTEQQHRGPCRLAEQQQLADQMQDVQGLPGNASRHVHCDDVADVLRDDAEAIKDGQGHHSTVHLAFQLDLLLAPSYTSSLSVKDLSGSDQWAADGEQRWQAEVAAKVPPEACTVIGQPQDVQSVWELSWDLNRTMFIGRHITVLCHQLSDEQLR